MKLRYLYIAVILSVLLFSISVGADKDLPFGKEKAFSDVSELNEKLDSKFKEHKDTAKSAKSTVKTTKKVSFDIDTDDISLLTTVDKEYDYLSIEGFSALSSPGEPMLPVKAIKVELPLGATDIEVSVKKGKYAPIEMDLEIVPAPEYLDWTQREKKQKEEKPKPNKKIYSSKNLYPGKLVDFDYGSDNENTVVYISLYPVQYSPKKQETVIFTDMDVEVSYSTESWAGTGNIDGYVTNSSGAFVSGVLVNVLQSEVVVATTFTDATGYYFFNDLSVASYDFEFSAVGYPDTSRTASISENITLQMNVTLGSQGGSSGGGGGSGGGSYAPGIYSTTAESIIITPVQFLPAAETLAQFHINDEGITTEVINTSWIDSMYNESPLSPYSLCAIDCSQYTSNGYDLSLALKIISFMRENHSNLKYVTLMGNAINLPPSDYVDVHREPATDFFYGSPDYDLVENYIVGRISVDTLAEAEKVVNKTMEWYHNVDSTFYSSTAVVGGRPWNTDFFKGELATINSINKGFLDVPDLRKYYATDDNFTDDQISSLLSTDTTGFVYQFGHGSGSGLHFDNYPGIYADDLQLYPPNKMVPVFVSIACSNGRFDNNIVGQSSSFAEGLLTSPAGAVAYIGGSRTNYGGPRVFLDRGSLIIGPDPAMAAMLTNVMEEFSQDPQTLGDAFTAARQHFLMDNTPLEVDIINELTFFAFVLLGDPALKLPTRLTTPTYTTPVLESINETGLVSPPQGNGLVPYFQIQSGDSVSVGVTSNSPSMQTKVVDVYEYDDEDYLFQGFTPSGSTFSFMPWVDRYYLVRTETEDRKEGWFYLWTEEILSNPQPDIAAYIGYLGQPVRDVRTFFNFEIENEGDATAYNVSYVLKVTAPSGNETILSADNIGAVFASERRDLQADWTPDEAGSHILTLETSTINDSDLSDNNHLRPVYVNGFEPDLAMWNLEIEGRATAVRVNETHNIYVDIENNGPVIAYNVSISLYTRHSDSDNFTFYANVPVQDLIPGFDELVPINWTPTKLGYYDFMAVVNCSGESYTENNDYSLYSIRSMVPGADLSIHVHLEDPNSPWGEVIEEEVEEVEEEISSLEPTEANTLNFIIGDNYTIELFKDNYGVDIGTGVALRNFISKDYEAYGINIGQTIGVLFNGTFYNITLVSIVQEAEHLETGTFTIQSSASQGTYEILEEDFVEIFDGTIIHPGYIDSDSVILFLAKGTIDERAHADMEPGYNQNEFVPWSPDSTGMHMIVYGIYSDDEVEWRNNFYRRYIDVTINGPDVEATLSKAPVYVNESNAIDFGIISHGSEDAYNVTLSIYESDTPYVTINSTVVHSDFFSHLPTSTYNSYSFDWTPTEVGERYLIVELLLASDVQQADNIQDGLYYVMEDPMIGFDYVEAYVEGVRYSNVQYPDIIIVQPDSVLEVEAEILNKFIGGWWDLTDVSFTVTIDGIDQGSDLVASNYVGEIEEGRSEDSVVYLQIPSDAPNGYYAITMLAQGEDRNRVLHTETISAYVAVADFEVIINEPQQDEILPIQATNLSAETNEPAMCYYNLDGTGSIMHEPLFTTFEQLDKAQAKKLEIALKALPPAAIAKYYKINIKLARYLRQRGGFERMQDTEFKEMINEISYNLNREVTLHPVERRVGEDEKESLFDYMFALEDITEAKDIFDDYFRNNPDLYRIEIANLNKLLKYMSMDDIRGVIRTVVDDPKQSLDEIINTVREKVKGKPNAEFIIREMEWILSNLFVLQQNIELLDPITEDLQEQEKTTKDAIDTLTDMDGSKSFDLLQNIASADQLDIIDILRLKLESITPWNRERIILTTLQEIDSMSEEDQEQVFSEIIEQFSHQPEESRKRIYMALLFGLEKSYLDSLGFIEQLRQGQDIKRDEEDETKPLAKDFLLLNMHILEDYESLNSYIDKIKDFDEDTKKNALKQLNKLYANRQPKITEFKNAPLSELEPTMKLMQEEIRIPEPQPQIPHAFYEPLLRLNADRNTLETMRQLVSSMNENPVMHDKLATLKNNLHEKLKLLSTSDFDKKDKIVSELLKAMNKKHKQPSVDNSEAYYDDLMFYLEQYSKAADTIHKADTLPKNLKKELLHLSETVRDNLLDEGEINLEAINELSEMLATIEADIVLARFKSKIRISDEKKVLTKLKKYAAHNPRFQWTDHEGRNIYKLIDIFLRTIKEKEIYQNIFDALMQEVDGNFRQWKYESEDYTRTIDDIIGIEVAKLDKAEQTRFNQLTKKAKGETLYEKMQNIEGFDEIKAKIEAIKNWEQTLSYLTSENGEEVIAEFTDDFYTLFNIGNYLGSTACQSCTYGSSLNKGLTGYTVNGANKAVAILDGERRVISRRIVRLRVMEDSEGNLQPAIFVEESTQFGATGIDKMYAVLDVLSQRTGLPVISSSYRSASTEKAHEGTRKEFKIILQPGRSANDYSDSYGGSLTTTKKETTRSQDFLVKPTPTGREEGILRAYNLKEIPAGGVGLGRALAESAIAQRVKAETEEASPVTTPKPATAGFSESLETFESSEGSQRVFEVTSELEPEIMQAVGEVDSDWYDSLAREGSSQISDTKIRLKRLTESGEMAQAVSEDSGWIIEVDKARYERKTKDLTAVEKEAALKLILAHELSEAKSKALGLSNADSHQVAMTMEGLVLAELADSLSEEELDNIKNAVWKERQDLGQIQHDVKALAELMAANLGIDISDAEIPTVRLARPNEEDSSYNPESNTISIKPDAVNNGAIYGEEIMHWLRRLAVPDQGELSLAELGSVDEFFGRLGESVARDVTRNTQYEYLFEDYSPRKLSDPEVLKRTQRAIKRSSDLISVASSRMESKLSRSMLLMEEMSRIADALSNANEERREEKISIDEFLEVVEMNQKSLVDTYNQNKDNNIREVVILFNKQVLNLYEIKKSLELIEEVRQSGEPVERELEEFELETMQRFDSIIHSLYETIELAQPQLLFGAMTPQMADLSLSNHEWHMRGYVAAEIFMQDNPGWADQLPDLINSPSPSVLENNVDAEKVNNWLKDNGVLEDEETPQFSPELMEHLEENPKIHIEDIFAEDFDESLRQEIIDIVAREEYGYIVEYDGGDVLLTPIEGVDFPRLPSFLSTEARSFEEGAGTVGAAMPAKSVETETIDDAVAETEELAGFVSSVLSDTDIWLIRSYIKMMAKHPYYGEVLGNPRVTNEIIESIAEAKDKNGPSDYHDLAVNLIELNVPEIRDYDYLAESMVRTVAEHNVVEPKMIEEEEKKKRLEEAKSNQIKEALSQDSAIYLRSLSEQGPLGRYIPEWAAIKGVRQHDFHRNDDGEVSTIDWHILKAVDNLKGLPGYRSLSEEDKKIADIAMFLHDIGKTGGSISEPDHPLESAKLVDRIMSSLGYAPDEINVVRTLVEVHDALGNLAVYGYSDVQPKYSPAELAEILGSKKNLDLLKLITEADIKAINPRLRRDYESETEGDVDRVYGEVLRHMEELGIDDPGAWPTAPGTIPSNYVAVYHLTTEQGLEGIMEEGIKPIEEIDSEYTTRNEYRKQVDELLDGLAPQGHSRKGAVYAYLTEEPEDSGMPEGTIPLAVHVDPKQVLVADIWVVDELMDDFLRVGSNPSKSVIEHRKIRSQQYWEDSMTLEDYLKLSEDERRERFRAPEILIPSSVSPDYITFPGEEMPEKEESEELPRFASSLSDHDIRELRAYVKMMAEDPYYGEFFRQPGVENKIISAIGEAEHIRESRIYERNAVGLIEIHAPDVRDYDYLAEAIVRTHIEHRFVVPSMIAVEDGKKKLEDMENKLEEAETTENPGWWSRIVDFFRGSPEPAQT
jgi:hypothetical protein